MVKKLKSALRGDAHFSELFRGSAIAFAFRIIGIALGYIFTLLITHSYGAEAMGVFALSFTVMQIAVVISQFGMDTAVLRFTSENVGKINGASVIHDFYKKAYKTVFPLSLFVSMLLYWLSPLLAVEVFHKENMTAAFQITSLGVMPMALLAIHREGLRGLKDIKAYAFFSNIIIPLLSSIGLLSFLLLNDKHSNIPVICQVGAIAVASIIAISQWYNKFTKIARRPASAVLEAYTVTYKHLLSVAFPMMFAGTLFMTMNWTDTLILGAFRSQDEVGIYSVALKVSLFTSITLMAINSIAAPKFSEMWGKQDLKGLEKVARQSSKMILWTTLPVLILFLTVPNYLLGFFGHEFVAGATVLMILALGQFFNAISGSVGILLSMTGHQMIIQNILVFSIIINIVLNYLLVQPYGITGVAVATAISTVLWNGLMVYFVWKKLGFITINLSR